MRHTAMKLTGIAFAALALATEAATVVSWKGSVTEGYWDDTANWGAFDPSNIDNWFRIGMSDKTVPYVISITNRQEIIGCVNFKLGGSMPLGVALDISSGVLKQVDGNGTDAITAANPFGIYRSDQYSDGPLYLSPRNYKVNTFLFSNTVFKASRTLEGDDATFESRFTGGYVSFAEPDGNNTDNILQSATDSSDAVRNFVFEGANVILPQFKPRSGAREGMVWFKAALATSRD